MSTYRTLEMLSITANGYLGNDPEERSHNGDSVVGFSLGSQDRKKNTVWLNCSVWGNSAKAAKTYLKKGMQITVQGRLSQNNYTKDGQQRLGLNVDVQDFTLPPKVDSTQASQVDTKSPNSLDRGNVMF